MEQKGQVKLRRVMGDEDRREEGMLNDLSRSGRENKRVFADRAGAKKGAPKKPYTGGEKGILVEGTNRDLIIQRRTYLWGKKME